MGWSIEYSSSDRFLYRSPNGDLYDSLSRVCQELLGGDEDCSVDTCDSNSGVGVIDHYDDVCEVDDNEVEFPKAHHPEAGVFWNKNGAEKRRERTSDGMKVKAKMHLSLMGWKFWYYTREGNSSSSSKPNRNEAAGGGDSNAVSSSRKRKYGKKQSAAKPKGDDEQTATVEDDDDDDEKKPKTVSSGRVFAGSVKCDCCGQVFGTLGGFEVHARTKKHRPTFDTILDDDY